MVHPALLRTFATPNSAAGRSPAGRSGWRLLGLAARLFGRPNRRSAKGYRPELHYMRGGRTAGAKSVAAG
jgi:hypothetical protein